jgi:hypothetical protein
MAGGNDNEDAQVGRWIEESKAIFANVANEAWLEWGQDILPHLAKTSKDQALVETEEALDDEFDTRMDKLFDVYLDKTKTMTKEEYEAKKKEIELEFVERRKKLREATGEGATISKEGDANAGDVVKTVEKGESRMSENTGGVVDVDKTAAGAKEVEAINVDDDENEDLARKSDAREGSKAIEGKAKEQGEVAKGSENAKEVVDKNAERKSRLRLMTPGRHDFRKVTGPVCIVFLHEIFAADLDFEVRSLCEFKSNVRLFEGLFPLCEV